MSDVIFQPLVFRNLTVKNRMFRSNISGRFDNYDGSGNQARINWELKFAARRRRRDHLVVRAGASARPHHSQLRDHRPGRPHPVLARARAGGPRARLQVHHAAQPRRPAARHPGSAHTRKGRARPTSSDPLHGFECDRMTIADIKEVVAAFAEGARRAREAGLDGVELHGANGYLITQFLSSAINDRDGRVRRLAGEPGPLRPRHRQGDPRAGRARLPPADEDQRDRIQQRALRPEARRPRQHRPGVGAGLQVAGRGRRGRHPRLHRQLVPASAKPGRTGSRRRSAVAHLRAAGVERHQHLPQPAVLPQRRLTASCSASSGGMRGSRRTRSRA